MSAAPQHWAPSARVYARRALILAVLTFAITFVLVWLWDRDQAHFLTVGLGLPFVLTAIFLLEDFSRWRGIRAEHWELEPPHLIHDGTDGRAMIPLSDIDTAFIRLGNVVLILTSGRRILMRYLADPAGVARTLNSLRAPQDAKDVT